MSEIVNWMQELPEPDRLALSTRYALLKALLEATHARAEEIQPEHLLLALMKQNDIRVERMCASRGVDLVAIHMHLQPLPKHPVVEKESRSSFFKKHLVLQQRAFQEWLQSSYQEHSGELKTGDVVEGVVVGIDQDEIVVDVGLESEGILPTKELPAAGYGSFNELHLKGRVLVYVLQLETPDGRVLLSLKRALIERQWRIAEEQYKIGELVRARVIDYNTGGLIVDISGIRGFVPISQILSEASEDGENQKMVTKLQGMKDREIQLKIIEINRERNRLILSERLAVQEWRQRRREELLDELKPGEIRRGVVSNIANFGLFVDLGGAEGLVHTSQLAWRHIDHPGELFKVGQEVEVQVLSIDKEKKKIALSIKRAQVDPWKTIEQRYTPGQVVTGVITKIAPFGAFARIEDGVEGLIRLSELVPGMDPKADLHEGQYLQLRILEIDTERRRLSLSLRQVGKVDVEEVPAEESGEIKYINDGQLSSYEETLKAVESTISPDAGEGKENLPFSQESLECLDWAISFAKHVHSPVAYPDHLLLSVLLQKRIQSVLEPLLPSPEALLAYFPGGITPGDAKSTSPHAGLCPSCKKTTLPGWKHCVYCGASLARICPKCGVPYPEIEEARFCFECGGELGA